MEKKPLFWCDPDKNTECSKSDCFIYGGHCRHTTHEEFSTDPTKVLWKDRWPQGCPTCPVGRARCDKLDYQPCIVYPFYSSFANELLDIVLEKQEE